MTTEEWLHCLRSASFFTGLPSSATARATDKMVVRHHPPDRVILLENDWGTSVYFVLQGWVKIRTYNLEGKEVTLNILGKGEMFGEMAPLDQVPRSTDVITLTEATIASIPAEDFVYLLQTEPKAGIHLAQSMGKRLRQLNRRLRMRESDSTARVVDILLFLTESQGRVTPEGVTIPCLPHRELSSLTGLARETVTRVLSKLEKQDLIRRDDDRDVFCIKDLVALEDLL
ncbi:MAG: Crp/Fnr family transcriptional regulator [Pseudanabaenaceae cyanobacterium SKYGB_i_bin29]|nr:Crp/Fnr family transcriptional regulator [Pseudanabaenaceae cyanobacterium SKYG29]MDW8420638.1 Crp/Fnr family transcriptional regulator [Pseudanabaenaceae cyanobacterium SKYGB_i_bin29]